MPILNGAYRRALCDGGYSVRGYSGHRESKQAFTQSWVNDHPESTIAVVKKFFENDAFFEAMNAECEPPYSEKKT